MINPTRTTLLGVLLTASLSGCSMFGNNEPEYLGSIEGEPLRIPEGLNRPVTTQQVLISVPFVRMPAGDELNPGPPRVVATAGRSDTRTFMAWSAQGVYLMVKDSPENVTQRLREIISSGSMTMLEDSDTGSHKFHYTQVHLAEDGGFFSSMAFWRSRPFDYSGVFMTRLQPDGDNTRVYLLFGNGETMDTAGAEHVLGVFMEQLS